MLTFFRRIRKELLGTGTARKYLLYAVGEVLLVMIGILLALQVNNWNEWRKERVVEGQILEDLKKAFISDIENQIEPNLGWVSRDLTNINVIISSLENRVPYRDSLAIHFRSLMTSKSFRWEVTAYKNLENEGLNVISNPVLKDEVVRIYNMHYPALEYRISNFSNNLIEYFRPEMREKFKFVHSEFNRNLYVPINYKELLDDTSFMNSLVTAKTNFMSIHDTLTKTKTQVEKVIEQIDQELY